MPFVILFSIFTAILTVRENLILATIFFIIIVIVGLIQKKIKMSKRLIISVSAFSISIFSVYLRQSLYSTNINQNKIFGTANISNIHDTNSYIINYQNKRFFLETDEKYQIGDNLFIEGNLASGFTGNILDIQNQRQNLTKISAYKFSYTKRLVTKNIKGTVYPTNITLQNKNKIGLISELKSSLQSKILSSYGKNRVSGLILGMLIGDKSALPTIDYENFRDSGLVHIIAVSGGNIVMIVIFLSFILFFLPFYTRIFVILLTIIFYALICGLDSSVLRATIMGGLGLIALLMGRNIDKWRILGIAYISMLVYNPYYLAYDIGFLFSFSAVIGIIVISEKEKIILPDFSLLWRRFTLQTSGLTFWHYSKKSAKKSSQNDPPFHFDEHCCQSNLSSKETCSISCPSNNNILNGNDGLADGGFIQKIRKHISIYLIPSIGASLGIFPFMMFFVGKINLISIFGNLLILPIIPFVMIYGFISVFIFDITGRHFILYIEEIFVNYIFMISDLVSKWGIYLVLEAEWLKYGLIILFVYLLVRISKKS